MPGVARGSRESRLYFQNPRQLCQTRIISNHCIHTQRFQLGGRFHGGNANYLFGPRVLGALKLVWRYTTLSKSNQRSSLNVLKKNRTLFPQEAVAIVRGMLCSTKKSKNSTNPSASL